MEYVCVIELAIYLIYKYLYLYLYVRAIYRYL
jgi:hypothetical protein